MTLAPVYALRWRHNDHAGVSNHQPHGCLLNRLFRRKLKKTSKLRVTGLCAGNSPGTGEFPAQMASYAENVSIWWRHHGNGLLLEGTEPLPELLLYHQWGSVTLTEGGWDINSQNEFQKYIYQITPTYLRLNELTFAENDDCCHHFHSIKQSISPGGLCWRYSISAL